MHDVIESYQTQAIVQSRDWSTGMGHWSSNKNKHQNKLCDKMCVFFYEDKMSILRERERCCFH